MTTSFVITVMVCSVTSVSGRPSQRHGYIGNSATALRSSSTQRLR